MNEFYVGYLPISSGLRKHVRKTVAALGVTALAVAAALVFGQAPFPKSAFEFHEYHDFDGTLVAAPYPALLVPGGTPWLLVAPGKHGFVPPPGADGRTVRLRGERIYRGEDRMIEVVPGSVADTSNPPMQLATIDLGPAEFLGEIVDSKCFFGVMNPGNGKVHRDCAARCIRGGIPPALLVRDANGQSRTILLANLRPELVDHVAEPVTLSGRLQDTGGRLIFYLE
jgi:hypothetical protein